MPSAWECGVLTTGPQRSPWAIFLKLYFVHKWSGGTCRRSRYVSLRSSDLSVTFCGLINFPSFSNSVVLRQHDYLPKWDPISKSIPCACLVTWHAHILVMNASCSPAISHVWSMLLLGTPFALEFLLTSLRNSSSFSLLLMLDSQGSVELSLLLLSFPGWFGLTFVALSVIYLLVPFKSLPSDSKAIYPSLYLTSPITWIKYFANWTPPKWILILPGHVLQFSLSHSMAPSLMELHSWTSWNCPWHLSFFNIYNPK